MMRTRNKISMLLCTLVALSFGAATVQATPDTDVANKQNFSTDVIYQIITDRLIDGDATNNPTGGSFSSDCSQLKLYCGGDWKGVQNAITNGYLTGMGITAIWISPTVENITSLINYSGVNNAAYHGYWGRDFKKTNPAFGSFTDFTNMVNAAHAAHIKVVIDWAVNDTSPQGNTGDENGVLKDNGTTLATYSNDPNLFFHHNGGTDFSTLESGIYRNLFDLADLNQNNSSVDTYLKAAIQVWLNLGVDGIRFDAVKHMPFGWQKNYMSYIYKNTPVFSFGEWTLGTGETSIDNQNFANKSGMNLLDFRFARMVDQVFSAQSANMTNLWSMLSTTATDYARTNDLVTFIDNHDMPRFQVVNQNGRYLEEALAFTLTARGAPAIYYGTEQYMTGTGDPTNRAKMVGFSTTTQAYKLIAALAPLRKTNPALAYGTTVERWVSNDVLITERQFGPNIVVTALNRNLTTGTPITGFISALPAGTYTDVLNGLGFNGNNITVSASGAVTNFTLAAGAIAVWQKTGAVTTPTVGHVGPMLGIAGNTITIDGRGFGATKGSVKFGTTVVSGASIASWEDTEIKVTVPSVAPGFYNVAVTTAGAVTSGTYNNFEILTSPQVTVRFVVDNATTTLGQSVYLTGDKFELKNWNQGSPIGPLFNVVEYQYPTWYFDVNVPASTLINFKFLRGSGGSNTYENGNNHTFTTPASGTATVRVTYQP